MFKIKCSSRGVFSLSSSALLIDSKRSVSTLSTSLTSQTLLRCLLFLPIYRRLWGSPHYITTSSMRPWATRTLERTAVSNISARSSGDLSFQIFPRAEKRSSSSADNERIWVCLQGLLSAAVSLSTRPGDYKPSSVPFLLRTHLYNALAKIQDWDDKVTPSLNDDIS